MSRIPDTPLQYITCGDSPRAHIDGALATLRGGCRWIQLRIKNAPPELVEDVARELLPHIRSYGATLLIDDHVEVALRTGADGVHLGLEDMPVPQAREILGPDAIIGATAHNLTEAINAAADAADYLGVGPFRFTTTKDKLAPRLGTKGLRDLLMQMRRCSVKQPVVAVGGIREEDIPDLLRAGIDNVAVASAIGLSPDPQAATERILSLLHGEEAQS